MINSPEKKVISGIKVIHIYGVTNVFKAIQAKSIKLRQPQTVQGRFFALRAKTSVDQIKSCLKPFKSCLSFLDANLVFYIPLVARGFWGA